jgi:hypothetical protein
VELEEKVTHYRQVVLGELQEELQILHHNPVKQEMLAEQ